MALFGPRGLFARPSHSVAGVSLSVALSLLAWPLLTGGAMAPSPAMVIADAPVAVAEAKPTAVLAREGNDLVITGSVAMLFNTGSFEGPNRAEKTNRARLTPDGTTVSAGFDAIRTHLAELRNPMPPALPSAPSDSSLRVISVNPNGTPALDNGGDNPDGTPIQVASIDPASNAALGAIDQIVPMPAAMPMMPTASLAYARETTPASATDLLVDKFGGKVSQKDVWCMANAIYFEARGESYRGQVAVGQVVMNRLAHPIYPKNICAVVYQNQQMRNACQFSFACDGIPETINDPKSWAQANEIAKGVINGSLYLPEVAKATHYHATYVYPDWAPRLKRVTKIGHHIFYQFKRSA